MRVIKIFLASSEELREDRRAFEIMLARLNPQWRSRDTMFDIAVWEDFIDVMTKEGLQSKYNEAVLDSDVFVMLLFTKVGRYTLEEFETAFANLATGSRPRIFTFFRNDSILTGKLGEEVRTLLDFKAKLQALKHYPTYYSNTEDLQWQFSRQMEMLYGSEGATSFEVTDATPQWKIGEIALVLGNRQLFGETGADTVDTAFLLKAVRKSTREVRIALLHMAQELRQQTWFDDKHRMARTIPVFEALVRTDSRWHVAHGNLGYALKDKDPPEYGRALESLTRAVELRGNRLHEGAYYQYSRVQCLIHLDTNFPRLKAEAETRFQVLQALEATKREHGARWEHILADPDADDIRTWLKVNGIE